MGFDINERFLPHDGHHQLIDYFAVWVGIAQEKVDRGNFKSKKYVQCKT